MESGGAAQGGNGGGDAGGQGGADAASADVGGGLSAADLTAQIQGLSEGQDALREMLARQADPTAEQPVADESLFGDLGWLGDEGGDDAAETPADTTAGLDPEGFATAMTEAIRKATAEAVAPHAQQLAEFRNEQRMAEIVNELPDMGDPEIATEVATVAAHYGQHLAGGDPRVAQALQQNPDFLRLVFMAGRAAEDANNEGGDAAAPAVLQGGGGASAGGGQQQQNLGDLIVNAGRSSNGARLPF